MSCPTKLIDLRNYAKMGSHRSRMSMKRTCPKTTQVVRDVMNAGSLMHVVFSKMSYLVIEGSGSDVGVNSSSLLID